MNVKHYEFTEEEMYEIRDSLSSELLRISDMVAINSRNGVSR